MTVVEKRLCVGSIPCLMVFNTHRPELSARQGTVLLYHGLDSRKEDNRKELVSFARQGYLAIGIDAVGHGERRYSDFKQRLSGEAFSQEFTEIVVETAGEIPDLVNHLQSKSLINGNRLAVCGISMGGYITYLAGLLEPRASVLMPILGAPELKTPMSPHKNVDSFGSQALLIQNAGQDVSVPPEPSRKFFFRLKEQYQDSPEKLNYVEFRNSGHFMRPEDWDELWFNVLEWTNLWLRKSLNSIPL